MPDDIDTTDATLDDFKVDQRVELHPGTDRWMMGDRFGTVTEVNAKRGVVCVLLDVSGKGVNFLPRNILKKGLR